MRLLLDTHVWIWMVFGSPRLSKELRCILEDESHELYLSPISVWEALMLAEKGKIEVDEEPVAWIRKALERSPVKEIGLNWEISVQSRLLTLPHNDPADRFIAASAIVYDMDLVTLDKQMRTLQGLRFLP